MKIIITGATGFVGKNLSSFLRANGDEALPLSLRDSDWTKKMNKDANAIIHLAGKAHDTKNTSADEEYFQVNRDLTMKLFDEFLKSNIKDFFYFSSVKATADSIDDVLDEHHSSNPQTPYGKSKLEAENYLLSKTLPENKRLFVIRPCMIHGPGNKGNLNLLYKVVEKGIPWPLANFENSRSFLSIDNLNFLISQMLSQGNLKSEIYNFSDDKPLSTNELVKIISNVLGKKEKLWRINAGLIKNAARIGDITKLPLNSERLKKLTESYVVSNKKIKSALDIDSLPFSVEEGLQKTIQSFQTKE